MRPDHRARSWAYSQVDVGYRSGRLQPPARRMSMTKKLAMGACAIAVGAMVVMPMGVMSSRPARALFGVGDVVFDPANFGEAVKSVVAAAKTIAEITQVVTMITRVVNAFGEGGPIAGLLALGGAASEYGLLDQLDGVIDQETKDALKDAGEAFKAGGQLYTEIGKLSHATKRLQMAFGQAGAWRDSKPRFPGWDIVPTLGHYATTTGTRGFTYEFLSAWAAKDPAIARVVQSRSVIEREVSALELHSTSLFNAYAASQAAERNKKLLEQAQNAKNSREQQAAQAATNLAILEELQAMRMQMATQGRFQSGQYLGSRNLVTQPADNAMWLTPGSSAPTTSEDLAKVVVPDSDGSDPGPATSTPTPTGTNGGGTTGTSTPGTITTVK